MATKPIKANAATNLAVAKAVGIEGAHLGTRCRAPFGSGKAADYYLVCYVPDDDCPEAMKEWSPTTCMDDAMEAASQVRPNVEDFFAWLLDIRVEAPLAICEAILTTAETKGDSQ